MSINLMFELFWIGNTTQTVKDPDSISYLLNLNVSLY